MPTCPCGRHDAKNRPVMYDVCCGPYHAGAVAPDAECLMRSRYSAFVRGDQAYLLATWHASTRPTTLELEMATKWLGLEVKQHRATGEHCAEVEFVARFRVAGRALRQHECSRFVREDSRWFYLDGSVR